MYRSGIKPQTGKLLTTRMSWDDLTLPLPVLTRRNGVSVQNSRYTNQELSYLLRRAEQYRGVVIISTLAKPYLGGHLRRLIDGIVEFS